MQIPSPKAALLHDWMRSSQPSFEDALAKVDDARARGEITREEYIAFLDAWWPVDGLETLLEDA